MGTLYIHDNFQNTSATLSATDAATRACSGIGSLAFPSVAGAVAGSHALSNNGCTFLIPVNASVLTTYAESSEAYTIEAGLFARFRFRPLRDFPKLKCHIGTKVSFDITGTATLTPICPSLSVTNDLNQAWTDMLNEPLVFGGTAAYEVPYYYEVQIQIREALGGNLYLVEFWSRNTFHATVGSRDWTCVRVAPLTIAEATGKIKFSLESVNNPSSYIQSVVLYDVIAGTNLPEYDPQIETRRKLITRSLPAAGRPYHGVHDALVQGMFVGKDGKTRVLYSDGYGFELTSGPKIKLATSSTDSNDWTVETLLDSPTVNGLNIQYTGEGTASYAVAVSNAGVKTLTLTDSDNGDPTVIALGSNYATSSNTIAAIAAGVTRPGWTVTVHDDSVDGLENSYWLGDCTVADAKTATIISVTHPYWNAAMAYDGDNTVVIIVTRWINLGQNGGGTNIREQYLLTSTDMGATWTSPALLSVVDRPSHAVFSGHYDTVGNRWVFTSYYNASLTVSSAAVPTAADWTFYYQKLNTSGGEFSVAFLPDGSCVAAARSETYVQFTRSETLTGTWSNYVYLDGHVTDGAVDRSCIPAGNAPVQIFYAHEYLWIVASSESHRRMCLQVYRSRSKVRTYAESAVMLFDLHQNSPIIAPCTVPSGNDGPQYPFVWAEGNRLDMAYSNRKRVFCFRDDQFFAAEYDEVAATQAADAAAVQAAAADIKNTRIITIGSTAVAGTLDITDDNPPIDMPY